MHIENCNIEPTRVLQARRLPDPSDTITEVAEAGAVLASVLARTAQERQLTVYELEVTLYDLERKFRLIESEMRRFHEIDILEALTAEEVTL